MTSVSKEQQEDYERRRLALMVPDPWTDPFCAKNGLVNMYIESTIAEILQLRAESQPGVKLNCPNPIYTKYHQLLAECLSANPTERGLRFHEFQEFIETQVLGRQCNIIKWNGYIPDIRLVDTIEEALGWLAHRLEV